MVCRTASFVAAMGGCGGIDWYNGSRGVGWFESLNYKVQLKLAIIRRNWLIFFSAQHRKWSFVSRRMYFLIASEWHDKVMKPPLNSSILDAFDPFPNRDLWQSYMLIASRCFLDGRENFVCVVSSLNMAAILASVGVDTRCWVACWRCTRADIGASVDGAALRNVVMIRWLGR